MAAGVPSPPLPPPATRTILPGPLVMGGRSMLPPEPLSAGSPASLSVLPPADASGNVTLPPVPTLPPVAPPVPPLLPPVSPAPPLPPSPAPPLAVPLDEDPPAVTQRAKEIASSRRGASAIVSMLGVGGPARFLSLGDRAPPVVRGAN